MKFLIDVCADSLPLRSTLLELGHDVLCARDHCPQASDQSLLAFALDEGRVLVTEDKDFGELVFLRGLAHPGIVRLCGMTPVQRANAMRVLIERHEQAILDGAIIVVTGNRVRVRSATGSKRL